jgi:hydroxymethylpyrimidine pyrophosphatase-like HAD family hydrolase
MDIAIDFDGTCVTHEFPEVGEEIGATAVLKRLVKQGHRLVLFTMRSNEQEHGDVLDELEAEGYTFTFE